VASTAAAASVDPDPDPGPHKKKKKFSKKKGKINLLCLLSAPLREQYRGLHSSGGLGEREPILFQDDAALCRASRQAAQVKKRDHSSSLTFPVFC
jgi:hypothetical protein